MLNIEHRSIRVDANNAISSEWFVPDSYDRRLGFIIAHGAGNDMHNPFLTFLHHSLGARGYLCVKFNFPYKEQGRRAPDHRAKLLATWRAVVEQVSSDHLLSPARLVLSGKSLGGRMASMLVADGCGADGLVFFGYPLHPSGQTEKIRSKHLANISCPMLFIQGTRDPLCDLDLLRREVLNPYENTSLYIIEGGDHSFKVPKRMQREEQAVWQEIVDSTVRWAEQYNAGESVG